MLNFLRTYGDPCSQSVCHTISFDGHLECCSVHYSALTTTQTTAGRLLTSAYPAKGTATLQDLLMFCDVSSYRRLFVLIVHATY
jgi:hypothetical protein